ncbi:MAG: TIR domain-containing protein [Actinophytocola sp.]|uniref:TIR domain-containing protein n=1 Tax=Actinophytocola sp. TaxID=1872138 RepID=UPI003C77450D
MFVNYRTADARFGAAAAYEELARRFGGERVFLDHVSLAPGEVYPDGIRAALEQTRVLVVLIGPEWLGAAADTGLRPVDRAGDWVRREIRRAVERDVAIIPVLLDGTPMPAPASLPPDIRDLTTRQAVEVRHRSLAADLIRLGDAVARWVPLPVRAGGIVPDGSSAHDPVAAALGGLAHAVDARWRDEELRRQVLDPFPLPVRWRSAPEKVMDHWENIRGVGPGVTVAPLDLSGELERIVAVYRAVPSGRLVVLGRAGAGKTVLSLRFVREFLRAGTAMVPVVFWLGSWEPTTDLREWLVDRLLRDHPGLAAPGPGGSTLATALVGADRILPVLDGFDEIAEGLRGTALRALGDAGLPFLMTSRTKEFVTAVERGDVLSAAAVVEVTDLNRTDLADYLPRTTGRTHGERVHLTTTVWAPVLTALQDRPDDPDSVTLAAVLTTPLMVSLARAGYSDVPDRDPRTLLDIARGGDPDLVEDHLLSSAVPTAYRTKVRGRRRWDADHARRWLGNLARHLHRIDTRNLAWWELGGSLSRPARTLLTGLASGLAFGFVNCLVMTVVAEILLGAGLLLSLVNGALNGVTSGLVAGIVFALLHRIGLWLTPGEHGLAPTRNQVRRFGATVPRHRRSATRFAIGCAAGFLFSTLFRFLTYLLLALLTGYWYPLGDAVSMAALYGLAVGSAVGIMARLEAPADITTVVSPTGLLKLNRVAVGYLALTWMVVFGIAGLILGGVSTGLGSVGGGVLNGIVIAVVGGIGGGLGYVVSLTAWGQWIVLARVWLPLTRRLPWRTHAFLADAHERGILRQAGAVYRFSHARLQDHLVGPGATRAYPAE